MTPTTLFTLGLMRLGPPECSNGIELLELFRRELLPAWFAISPAKLESLAPFELQTIAEGVGAVLAPKGPVCGAQFAFSGREKGVERHDRVVLVFRGPKTAMVGLAKQLLNVTLLEPTDEDLERMQDGEATDFSKRLPEDPREPGVLTMVTMKLEPRREWEFEFRQSKDPAQSVRH